MEELNWHREPLVVDQTVVHSEESHHGDEVSAHEQVA